MSMYIIKFFPLITAFIMPLTFLITYAWAVSNGHVEPDFPYISSTGANPPESNFFSLMLNISSVFLALTVWAKHRQIVDHCSQTVVGNNLPKTSRIASVFGYASAFGVCLVGNFQSSTITSVHLIGAAMAFGIGTVYLWMQSWMSISLAPRVNSHEVMVTRFVCSVTATLMIITSVLFSILHDNANDDVAYWTTNVNWWRSEGRKKWVFHVIATASEWVLAGTFTVVLLTFVPEFKRMNFQGISVEYDRDRSQTREATLAQSTETVETIRL